MASEAALKAGIGAAGLGMLALAFAAGALLPSPRLATLCGLAALPLALLAWRCLARLSHHPRQTAADLESASGGRDAAALAATLVLEARLEHAPIALFQIGPVGGEGAVAPLNASARRLVAPGRASDPSALYRQLAAQPAGGRVLVGYDTERGAERGLLSVSSLTLHGEAQRLAALMPVETELEAEALAAWRQLVHVLTHEIMNSLTPVASLSRTARDLLEDLRGELDADVSADLSTALDAISRRAASLADFVGGYRSLSSLPPPRPERVALGALFARVEALVGPAWRAAGGGATFSVEPGSLELVADPGQLEQALINLLKNALEACQGKAAPGGGPPPSVAVTARMARGGRLRIEVADNGPGVPDDLAAQIFTPFFSTKKQGGGIGLAMVRQLVHGNGGTVRHAKPLGAGARFVVTF